MLLPHYLACDYGEGGYLFRPADAALFLTVAGYCKSLHNIW